MIELDKLVRAWLYWSNNADWHEAQRIGFKPQGIEYKLMMGELPGSPPKESPGAIILFDRCWTTLSRFGYEREMYAIRIYYLRKKSERAVAQALGESRHSARKRIKDGQLLLIGAMLLISD